WPYRVRFGLSLGCAAMVALLWFTELGAVYPLLKILFNSQNCQTWVAEKIEALETEIQVTAARLGEIDAVPGLAAYDESKPSGLLAHIQGVHADCDAKGATLRDLERRSDDPGPKAPAPRESLVHRALLEIGRAHV